MKKIIHLLIIILFLSAPVFAADYYGGTGGGVSKDTNCNQSKYFAIGKLCADTDDGKLYKGTGAAVAEVGAGMATIVTKASSGALSQAERVNTLITNTGQTGDVTMTIGTILAGEKFNFIANTTVAKYYRLDPDAPGHIYLDGLDCGEGKYIGIASIAKGNILSCAATEDGVLHCLSSGGTWACE